MGGGGGAIPEVSASPVGGRGIFNSMSERRACRGLRKLVRERIPYPGLGGAGVSGKSPPEFAKILMGGSTKVWAGVPLLEEGGQGEVTQIV